jgi:hypothetical protein
VELGEERVDERLCLLLEKDEQLLAAARFQLRLGEVFFEQRDHVLGELLVVRVAAERLRDREIKRRRER